MVWLIGPGLSQGSLTKKQVFFGILLLTKTQATGEDPNGLYQPYPQSRCKRDWIDL